MTFLILLHPLHSFLRATIMNYHKQPVLKTIGVYTLMGFPDSSVGKESSCNAGDPGSIPVSGRSPGKGIGYPLQYSWTSLVAQLVKLSPAMQDPWVGKIPWRRRRLPTLVFWAGEFHGLYIPWDCKELDMTEQLSLSLYVIIGVEAGNLNKTRWSVLLLQGIGENAFLFLWTGGLWPEAV